MQLSVLATAKMQVVRAPVPLMQRTHKPLPSLMRASVAFSDQTRRYQQPRKALQFLRVQRMRTHKPLRVSASADAADSVDPFEASVAKVVGPSLAPTVVTGGYIAMWYALNVAFNLQNKLIYGFFPFPWTVSTVHVVVGLLYCVVAYAVGAKGASFGRAVTKQEFGTIFGPASMHALGHIAANISFAAVAISLSHTVKTLEPAFNVILSKVILNQPTPLPVLLTLAPIMVGVAMASAAEITFNWLGFLSAMASNLTFGFRAVWSKKAMKDIKNLDSTALYAWTTFISVLICLPLGLLVEGPTLKAGIQTAIDKVGLQKFVSSLLSVGLLYHLYNQFAFNTLGRVSPVSHGVCNVVKRIVIIGTSVLFFGNTLTTQTKVGTAVALLGTYLYTETTKKKPAPPAAPATSAA